MLFSSLYTIIMQINPDRHQSIHSFFKTRKIQLTSEQGIFVVTNYLRTRSFKEVQQLFEQHLKFRQLKGQFGKMLKSTRLKDQV